jgi:hypothetical protein
MIVFERYLNHGLSIHEATGSPQPNSLIILIDKYVHMVAAFLFFHAPNIHATSMISGRTKVYNLRLPTDVFKCC